MNDECAPTSLTYDKGEQRRSNTLSERLGTLTIKEGCMQRNVRLDYLYIYIYIYIYIYVCIYIYIYTLAFWRLIMNDKVDINCIIVH